MPQVKQQIPDGWYRNEAVDKNDKPRPLDLGTVNLKPGAERFIPGRVFMESRFAYGAAHKAMANGNLKPIEGPDKASPPEDEVETEVTEPEVETEVTEPEVTEPEVEPSVDELKEKYSKAELVAMAKEMGIDHEGNKSDVAQCIVDSRV